MTTFDLYIPAHNEASIIVETLNTLVAALEQIPNLVWRVVVVDNASTDDTARVVTNFAHPAVSVMRIEEKGKGAALVAAAKASAADVFGFIDADLSVDPSHFAEFLSKLEFANIVIGSRLLGGARVDRSFLRTLSSQFFNFLRKVLLGVHVVDSQCGLKLADANGRLELARSKETGWFFDVEWLARAERAGLIVVETPITWTEQRFAGRKSQLRVFRDGLEAVRAFVRIRNRLAREGRSGEGQDGIE